MSDVTTLPVRIEDADLVLRVTEGRIDTTGWKGELERSAGGAQWTPKPSAEAHLDVLDEAGDVTGHRAVVWIDADVDFPVRVTGRTPIDDK